MEDNTSNNKNKFRIDARLELVANFHSNSVVGRNIGGMKIIFENPA